MKYRNVTFALTLVPFSAIASSVSAQQLDLRSEWSRNATEFRGQNGRRVTLVCPAGATPSRVELYGTDTYTDDSPICVAAVHAGVIPPGSGGVVTLVIDAGKESYEGSTRNAVVSRAFAKWAGSYSFERSGGEGRLDWRTTARGLSIAGKPLTLVCPPAGEGSTVTGTDIYTDDSSICTAAVHAGVITFASGGRVKVDPVDGQQQYRASPRNGVSTREYGSWPNSFRVSAATVAAVSPSIAQATPVAAPSTTQLGTAVPITRSEPAPTLGGDPPAVHATNFNGSGGNAKVVLTWTAAPRATGYRLARGTWDPAQNAFVQSEAVNIPNKAASEAGGLIAGTTFTDLSVSAGKQYKYWLDTWFTGAQGDLYSAPPGAYPMVTVNTPNAPASPTNLAAVSGPGYVSLKWTAAPGAIGYLVRRTDGASTVTLNDRIPRTDSLAPSPYFVDTSPAGQTYGYRVMAVYASATGERYSSDPAQAPSVSATPRSLGRQDLPGLKVTGLSAGDAGDIISLVAAWEGQVNPGWEAVVHPDDILLGLGFEVWDPTGSTAGVSKGSFSPLAAPRPVAVSVSSSTTDLANSRYLCDLLGRQSAPMRTRLVRLRMDFEPGARSVSNPPRGIFSVYSRPVSFTARVDRCV